ncbi:Spy/CpxP family protein refolding chaperone [Aidingimonas halophila]|uniref:LTXXQ motif family protein n=1 Tax=Aidingimonas halophila TaxID=574349 RepID=A0A1H3G8G4_9GAMM|nr:Spy/CpxP family protein refolding chaperone [Aidingimonas halophila]GHC32728.1 hypothetical protein GCM10008094_26800 [Aidingimonas halophila]SDX99330.1 hypothetical protein SAMN05443545_10936 [Aidingimonas halophila]
MKIATSLAAALASIAISVPVMAQQMGGGAPSVDDQVEQLDQIVDLDADQEEEVRSLLNQMQESRQQHSQESQELQQSLGEHVGADYNEAAIRSDAQALGDLTAEMTAERLILQSKMEAVFTQEQRDALDEEIAKQQQQMQQMQEQMQQQGQ